MDIKSIYKEKFYKVVVALFIVGLVISLYLAYEYSLPKPINCLAGGTGCEIVRLSKYAIFLGLPMPFWGVMYFLFGIFYLFWPKTLDLDKCGYIDKHIYGLFTLVLFGFLFETYLTYLEIFVIKSICTWCVAVEVTLTVLLVVSWRLTLKVKENSRLPY